MGCEGSEQLVWADGHGNRFFVCPMQFVTDDILSWYEEYEYYKEFNVAPNYENQSSRFIEAWMCYKYWYQVYDYDRQEKHSQKIRERNNG